MRGILVVSIAIAAGLIVASIRELRGTCNDLVTRLAAWEASAAREKGEAEAALAAVKQAGLSSTTQWQARLREAERRIESTRTRQVQPLLATVDLAASREALEATASRLQDTFEWRYLWHQLEESIESRVLHDGAITRLVAAVDGSRLATLGSDGLLVVWSTHPFEELTWLDGMADVVSLAISADGSTVAVGDELGVITLYDATTMEIIREFAAHDGPVWSLAYASGGGDLVSVGEDRTIATWRGAVVTATSAPGPPSISSRIGPIDAGIYTIAVDRCARTIAAAGEDGKLRVWSDGSDSPREIDVSQEWGAELSLSDDGTIALLRTDSDEAWWIDVTSERPPFISRPAADAYLSGDGARGWVVNRDGEITRIDPRRREVLGRMKSGVGGIDQIVVPRAQEIYFAAGDRRLLRFDVARTPARTYRRLNGETALAVALDMTQERIAIGTLEGTRYFIDAETLETIDATTHHEGAILSLVFDKASERHWSGGIDGAVVEWEGPSAAWRSCVAGGGAPVDRIDVSSRIEGADLLAVRRDGSRERLDLFTDRSRSWPPPAFAVLAVDIARGKMAWSAAGGNVRIWDGATGLKVAGFRISELGPISALALAPDGHDIAVAMKGGDIEIWSVDRSVRRLHIDGVGGRVTDLEFDRYSHALYAVDSTGVLLRVDRTTGDRLLEVELQVTEPRAIAVGEWFVVVVGVDGVEVLHAPKKETRDE